jgi:hypothetical protein
VERVKGRDRHEGNPSRLNEAISNEADANIAADAYTSSGCACR